MEPGAADEAPSGAYGGSRPSQTGLEPPPEFAYDGRGTLFPIPGPADLDTLGKDILEAIAAETAEMESLLTELVRAPTTRGNEAPGQAVMRDAFGELGLAQVDVPMDADALRAHPGHSPFSWDVSDKVNVVGTWQPGDAAGPPGRSLIMNGHVDVVSPEPLDRWSVPAFDAVRDGDWLYGRGAADMKCGLAAVLGAVRGLRALGLSPRAPVHLESVVEEECTGNGTLQCVLAGFTADAAIVAEPFGAAITTSQVGVLWFDVRVCGVSGHAAEEGTRVNAIEKSFDIARALRELEAELNADPPAPYDRFAHPINLNVGVIRGGDWPSTVPGECVISYRLAQYPGRPIQEVQDRLEAVVAAAGAGNGDALAIPPEVRYDGFRSEGYSLSDESPLVAALAAAFGRQSGASPALVATTGTTDAGILGLYGNTPSVCFGPYAEEAHGVDERVYLPSVVQTAQVMGLFIRDWCGLDA